MKTAAIIPAHNEEATVAQVVEAARPVVDEVIVVDNASTDATAEKARAAGARVVHEPVKGKGQAMATGVRATDADVLVFLDADLVGLTPEHVRGLLQPVLDGDVVMTRGVLSRGEIVDELTTSGLLPFITGQRAMLRVLFEELRDKHQEGFRPEAGLEGLVKAYKLRTETILLDGVDHRTKEEKWGPVDGAKERWRMMGQVAGALALATAGYRARRWIRRGLGAIVRRL